ncbi:MAG: PHB depolymerase family esterase [Myxococcota bacterium]|nr:PHB depolymerase family esterase [Myxococcota bacterium]
MNQLLTLALMLSLSAGFIACSSDTDPQANQILFDAAIDVSISQDMTGQGEIADMGTELDNGLVNESDAAVTFPPHSTGLSRHMLQHDGLVREYLLYVPESYTPTEPSALLLNFHGNGLNADSQLATSDMRPFADESGTILVYPTGSVLDGEGTHWNPLLDSPNNKSDADDFGFVAAMLDRLSTEFNVDASRVYATGYSNGAGMVYGLACYLSDRVAAFAPVSGSMWTEMPGNCDPVHPTAIAIFNGTQDFERPFNGYDGFLMSADAAAGFWVQHNGIADAPAIETFMSNGLTIERKRYTGGRGGAGVDLYKVIGGGHDWFDIDVAGQSLDQLIWDFLAQHDINGLRP